MFSPRIIKQVSRLATSQKTSVSVQARRTIYPHYMKYMVTVIPGTKPASFVNKILVYLGFVFGIMGPPTFIICDVAAKRPDSIK